MRRAPAGAGGAGGALARTQVTVVVGERRLLRPVTRGYSFLCTHDPRAHFGLGDAAAVDRVEVRWPDGTHERFPGTEADRIVTLEKGRGER